MIGTVKLYKPYMNSRKRMVKAMAKIAKQLTELIGNTPLLELTNYEKENELEANLIVKLEYFNPLGSVKDRVAHAMIEQGIADFGCVLPHAVQNKLNVAAVQLHKL